MTPESRHTAPAAHFFRATLTAVGDRTETARSPTGTFRLGRHLDPVVTDERIWLDGPVASASHVGVRGYRYPPFEGPSRGVATDAYTIVLYVAGRTAIRRRIGRDEERCEVGPGDLSLQPPLIAARWGWASSVDVLHVYIEPSYLRELAREELGGLPSMRMRHGLCIRDEALSHLGRELVEELRPPRELASERATQAIGERMAIRLLRTSFDLDHATDSARTFSDEEIADLRELVTRRLGDDVPLAGMAHLVGLGVHHFCRVFRQTFGESPHGYLRARRLERAHQLVVTTATPISEIAMLTGFADQSHLTRCFKQRFGEPPAHLRRALRPVGAVVESPHGARPADD
jgi:AraC family transcriptional regulator